MGKRNEQRVVTKFLRMIEWIAVLVNKTNPLPPQNRFRKNLERGEQAHWIDAVTDGRSSCIPIHMQVLSRSTLFNNLESHQSKEKI